MYKYIQNVQYIHIYIHIYIYTYIYIDVLRTAADPLKLFWWCWFFATRGNTPLAVVGQHPNWKWGGAGELVATEAGAKCLTRFVTFSSVLALPVALRHLISSASASKATFSAVSATLALLDKASTACCFTQAAGLFWVPQPQPHTQPQWLEMWALSDFTFQEVQTLVCGLRDSHVAIAHAFTSQPYDSVWNRRWYKDDGNTT